MKLIGTQYWIILSETRLARARVDSIKRKVSFANGINVDSVGWNRGLTLLWNDNWDLHIQSFSKAISIRPLPWKEEFNGDYWVLRKSRC